MFSGKFPSPGAHQLSVRFEREGTTPPEVEEPHPEEHGVARPAPARLSLDTAVTVVAGEVLLVTYDEDRLHLVLRGLANRASP